jgi:predicted metal-dependent peptidase
MSKESEDKIAKARVGMLIDLPFFGYLALNLQPVQTDNLRLPTVATDGRRLLYDDDFVKETSLGHLQFMIAHLVGHVVLEHLPRRKGRKPDIWNRATDFVINALLVRHEQFKDNHPEQILLNPDWDDKTADWVYAQIPDT